MFNIRFNKNTFAAHNRKNSITTPLRWNNDSIIFKNEIVQIIAIAMNLQINGDIGKRTNVPVRKARRPREESKKKVMTITRWGSMKTVLWNEERWRRDNDKSAEEEKKLCHTIYRHHIMW